MERLDDATFGALLECLDPWYESCKTLDPNYEEGITLNDEMDQHLQEIYDSLNIDRAGWTQYLECKWDSERIWLATDANGNRHPCPDYSRYEQVSCKFDYSTETWHLADDYSLCPDGEYYAPSGCRY